MGVLIEDREFDGSQCGEYDPITRTAYIDPHHEHGTTGMHVAA